MFESRLIQQSSQKNALIYCEDIDLDTEAWAPFPLVDFKKYSGGKRKVCAQDIDYKIFLELVAKYYRNGIVVIDEGRLHESYKLSAEMIRIVSIMRKIGVDLYINYHGLRGLPVEQFHYVNNVVLFHTTDNFKSKQHSIPEMAALQDAQRRIKAKVFAGNKYYSEVLQLVP